MPVRTPCPISERLHVMVTIPSSAMETKRLGWTEAPVDCARAAESSGWGTICAPSTIAPVMPVFFKKSRRLTFCMPDMV